MLRPLTDFGAEFAGVAIARTSSGFHTGVVYKDGSPRLLHQAFHNDLRDELVPEGFLWVRTTFHPDRLRLVAAFCRLLARQKSSLSKTPYAFRYFGETYDRKGVWAPRKGIGLTCATFVLAVFHQQGLALVLEAEWTPREDDKASFESLCALMSREHPKQATTLLLNERGCARFRPDEVAAGAHHATESSPCSFALAVTTGAAIRARLAEHIEWVPRTQ